jgi:hypothetical protein
MQHTNYENCIDNMSLSIETIPISNYKLLQVVFLKNFLFVCLSCRFSYTEGDSRIYLKFSMLYIYDNAFFMNMKKKLNRGG